MVLRTLSTCAGLFASALWVASAQTDAGTSAQQMLDFLAKPLPATGRMGLPKDLPNHFADWSEAQKQSGFQLVVQRCGLIFALEHDNPAARMVPEAMTKQEEAQLAVSVCVPAKLPEDWPERHKYLATAQQLIEKANADGASLSLPANLRSH